jgi:hypothetical protein
VIILVDVINSRENSTDNKLGWSSSALSEVIAVADAVNDDVEEIHS